MGYGDFMPSGGQHHKKPLTKAQIKKLEQAYATAGAITESVKTLEKEEQDTIKNEIEKNLNLFY
ncbi:hypothetical protein HOO68_01765 [Candidatus Gracilibacteria bacterium]|nr:hypothetical protein [Candidatus Gracilibacteria bacterium]